MIMKEDYFAARSERVGYLRRHRVGAQDSRMMVAMDTNRVPLSIIRHLIAQNARVEAVSHAG